MIVVFVFCACSEVLLGLFLLLLRLTVLILLLFLLLLLLLFLLRLLLLLWNKNAVGRIMWWGLREAWRPPEDRTTWVHLEMRPACTPTDTPIRGDRGQFESVHLSFLSACILNEGVNINSAPSLQARTRWLWAAVSSQHGLQFPSAPVPSTAGDNRSKDDRFIYLFMYKIILWYILECENLKILDKVEIHIHIFSEL